MSLCFSYRALYTPDVCLCTLYIQMERYHFALYAENKSGIRTDKQLDTSKTFVVDFRFLYFLKNVAYWQEQISHSENWCAHASKLY